MYALKMLYMVTKNLLGHKIWKLSDEQGPKLKTHNFLFQSEVCLEIDTNHIVIILEKQNNVCNSASTWNMQLGLERYQERHPISNTQ